jgi:RNA polymerase sigma-70 factor, ECF subfamily
MWTPGTYAISNDNAHVHCDAQPIRTREDLATAMIAVTGGDKAAFALVYAATAAKLFGIIMRIVRRRDAAEDVLQEVYLRIWQHANTFDARCGSPITWMATIARRCALDAVRRKDTLHTIEECPEVLRLVSDGSLASDDDNVSRDLTAALQRLSSDKRSIIVQAYCYGLTREEIARRTGRPIPTVKTWLRRGLAELKIYLIEQESAALAAPACLAPAIYGECAQTLTKCVANGALSST